jgi:hypothetical protein
VGPTDVWHFFPSLSLLVASCTAGQRRSKPRLLEHLAREKKARKFHQRMPGRYPGPGHLPRFEMLSGAISSEIVFGIVSQICLLRLRGQPLTPRREATQHSLLPPVRLPDGMKTRNPYCGNQMHGAARISAGLGVHGCLIMAPAVELGARPIVSREPKAQGLGAGWATESGIIQQGGHNSRIKNVLLSQPLVADFSFLWFVHTCAGPEQR